MQCSLTLTRWGTCCLCRYHLNCWLTNMYVWTAPEETSSLSLTHTLASFKWTTWTSVKSVGRSHSQLCTMIHSWKHQNIPNTKYCYTTAAIKTKSHLALVKPRSWLWGLVGLRDAIMGPVMVNLKSFKYFLYIMTTEAVFKRYSQVDILNGGRCRLMWTPILSVWCIQFVLLGPLPDPRFVIIWTCAQDIYVTTKLESS